MALVELDGALQPAASLHNYNRLPAGGMSRDVYAWSIIGIRQAVVAYIRDQVCVCLIVRTCITGYRDRIKSAY